MMTNKVENKNVVKCVYEGTGTYLQPISDRRVIPPLFDDYEVQRIYCPTHIESDEGLYLMYPEGVPKYKVQGYYDELLHMKETINCLHEGDELIQFTAIKRVDKQHGRVMVANTVENGETLEVIQELNENGYDIYINLNPLKVSDRLKPSTSENIFEDLGSNMVAVTPEDVKQIKYFAVRINPIKFDGDDSECDIDHYYERTEAEMTAWRVLRYLKNEMGFETCFMACTGDGYHLIWRVDLDPTPENDELLQQCRLALAHMFDTDSAYISSTPYQREELVRLYGTVNYDNPHTPKHPVCGSYIVHAPQKMKVVDVEKLEALAENIPEEDLVAYYEREDKNDEYKVLIYKNEKFQVFNVLLYLLNRAERFCCPNDGTNYIQLADDFGTNKFYELTSTDLTKRLVNEYQEITGKSCADIHAWAFLQTADSMYKLKDDYEEIRKSGICPPVKIPSFTKVLYK